MLYSWLVVSIHIWLEQCFKRITTELMHQVWHFKCIQIQSFGRRNLDYLHSCMDVPIHWISHLSTQLVCRFGTWNHSSTIKIQNAKKQFAFLLYLHFLEMWLFPWEWTWIASGWAHHMCVATVKWNGFHLLRSCNLESIKHHSRTSQTFFCRGTQNNATS